MPITWKLNLLWTNFDEKRYPTIIRCIKKNWFFIKKYPKSDYAIDLKFKKDLIENQLAAKELLCGKILYIYKKMGASN